MLFIFSLPAAYASWRIDAKKFHISVHGQIECLECHEDIERQDVHPNPYHVNRNLQDFFHVDTCLSCHDDVADNLGEGVHGTKKIENPGKYELCIDCHNPHYQVPSGDSTAVAGEGGCGTCHENRTSLPPPSDEERVCMACHQSLEPEDPRKAEKNATFCFYCHGSNSPVIDQSEYRLSTHAGIDCITCHPEGDRYNHATQKQGDCRQCHAPHHEKVSHDAHAGVACQACHLKNIIAIRDPESKAVIWKKSHLPGMTFRIHHMVVPDDESACKQCHFEENPVGAVSMILPPKSILCMPCHVATFSVGDATTILALVFFLGGLVMASSVWLSGTLPGENVTSSFYKAFKLLCKGAKVVLSRKIVLIITTLFYDVFLQRRLYNQSKKRWFIHSLIFFPFMLRFAWGITALMASLWFADCTRPGLIPELIPELILDKNNPVTAFLFDLTGIMILIGVVLAFLRGCSIKPYQSPGLPGQDKVALGLIGGIIVIGFILEGIRIAMTGSPGSAIYSVVGYGISILFTEMTGLTGIYGYIWYIHAIMTGLFAAYIPFSRLMHIIMAPVVFVMNAVSD